MVRQILPHTPIIDTNVVSDVRFHSVRHDDFYLKCSVLDQGGAYNASMRLNKITNLANISNYDMLPKQATASVVLRNIIDRKYLSLNAVSIDQNQRFESVDRLCNMLPQNNRITEIDNRHINWFEQKAQGFESDGNDVGVDESKAIVVAHDTDGLVARGLAPCVGFSGFGRTDDNKLVLGLVHSSGDGGMFPTAQESVQELRDTMEEEGADLRHVIDVFPHGGEKAPSGFPNSLNISEEVVANWQQLGVKGAKLNMVESRYDQDGTQIPINHQSTDSLTTPQGVFVYRNPTGE